MQDLLKSPIRPIDGHFTANNRPIDIEQPNQPTQLLRDSAEISTDKPLSSENQNFSDYDQLLIRIQSRSDRLLQYLHEMFQVGRTKLCDMQRRVQNLTAQISVNLQTFQRKASESAQKIQSLEQEKENASLCLQTLRQEISQSDDAMQKTLNIRSKIYKEGLSIRFLQKMLKENKQILTEEIKKAENSTLTSEQQQSTVIYRVPWLNPQNLYDEMQAQHNKNLEERRAAVYILQNWETLLKEREKKNKRVSLFLYPDKTGKMITPDERTKAIDEVTNELEKLGEKTGNEEKREILRETKAMMERIDYWEKAKEYQQNIYNQVYEKYSNVTPGMKILQVEFDKKRKKLANLRLDLAIAKNDNKNSLKTVNKQFGKYRDTELRANLAISKQERSTITGLLDDVDLINRKTRKVERLNKEIAKSKKNIASMRDLMCIRQIELVAIKSRNELMGIEIDNQANDSKIIFQMKTLEKEVTEKNAQAKAELETLRRQKQSQSSDHSQDLAQANQPNAATSHTSRNANAQNKSQQINSPTPNSFSFNANTQNKSTQSKNQQTDFPAPNSFSFNANTQNKGGQNKSQQTNFPAPNGFSFNTKRRNKK
ncbi:MAG: hypothetical protein LBI69_05175 [Puniceicoccales bacterium]|nr:hypothetical protein [Puniceicoccales bacterium]